MDRIPNEIKIKILRKLSINQIMICMQLNKEWCLLIKTMIKPKELAIVNFFQDGLLIKQFHSNEYVYDYNFHIDSDKIRSIYFKKNQMFSQIKKLYISHKKIGIDCLNNLKQLEALELKSTRIYIKKEYNLILPELKSLSLNENRFEHGTLMLDSPKLENFKLIRSYAANRKLQILHPESVKLFYGSFYEFNFSKLVNLETYINPSVSYIFDNLLGLKKLRELHCLGKIYDAERIRDFYGRTRRKFLKIYVEGFSLDSLPALDDERWNNTNYWREFGTEFGTQTSLPYEHNYELSNPLYFMRRIDYNFLMELDFKSRLIISPIEFVKRSINLQELNFNERDCNLNDFYNFLKELKYLKTLTINRTLEQNFYDQILPVNLKVLENLVIRNTSDLNFDFILKFKDIQALDIKEPLALDLIAKIFKKFKFFRKLDFFLEGRPVQIETHNQKRFKLKYNNEINLVFENVEELAENLTQLTKDKIDKREEYLINNCIFK